MKKKLFLLMQVMFSINLFCQVGINTDEPNTNTALHISEKMKSTDPDTNNKLKGIIIPRLTQVERDKLTYSDAPQNNTLKLASTDNSLMIFNTTENCYNFWNTEDKEWKSICGNLGNAKFTFDCSNLTIKGTYIRGKETDGTHYIQINNINVTKAGAYQISASSTQNNGYSFSAQGTFLTTGLQNLKLLAQGTPTTVEIDNFTVANPSNVSAVPCPISINVLPDIASYSIDCSTVIVNGTYLKGTNLSATNSISLYVTVNTLGSYEIKTDLINGVQFSKTGNFTSTGKQLITLEGSGSPTVNDDFMLSISSNSIAGATNCSAKILITLPSMKYAVIGSSGSVYTWDPSTIRAQAFNNTSFGPAGIVKIQSLTNDWSTTDINQANTYLKDVNRRKPDILLFFSYGAGGITDDFANTLSNYVNNGGVLIYGTKDGIASEPNTLMKGIFGNDYSTANQQQIAGTGSSDDNVYPISSNDKDPIINGPFGNTAGKYWGEDNGSTGTIVTTKLPPNSVQIASANNQFSKQDVDPNYSTVWYNNSKNFVFFGDSTGASTTDQGLNDYPTYYVNGIPKYKRYGQWPNQVTQAQFVYNSFLELNAIAWALKKAATVGINNY